MITKTRLYKIVFLVSFWTAAFYYLVFFEATTLGFRSLSGKEPYPLSAVLKYGTLVAVGSALIVAIFEILYFNTLLRKKPFGQTLFLKTMFYLSCIITFITLANLLIHVNTLGTHLFDKIVWRLYLQEFVYSGRILVAIVYWGFAIAAALFLVQVSDKFGQGVLINFLRGKYHQPQQEKRIFMFLDLKSSTTIAEKLGHIKYSQLLQECFFDLTDVVSKYGAGIYQYVGDEVVLTWGADKGMNNGACAFAFFAYEQLLSQKGTEYERRFGLRPEFKASLNMGTVTVAEVGELKKELAYHGDVLNTAARIQSKCNEYNSRFLVAEIIRDALAGNNDFEFRSVGEVMLRGKEQAVNIFDLKLRTN